MEMRDLLSARRVEVGLTATTRADALRVLADRFANDCGLGPEEIARALEARELLATTNVGMGVAIPHARLPGAGPAMVAIAVCPDGLCYCEDEGGDPVTIVAAVLTDQNEPKSALESLVLLARALRVERVRTRLRAATAPRQVIEALVAAPQRHEPSPNSRTNARWI